MKNKMKNKSGTKTSKREDMFVNAQWALGGEGTGAPVHFHNTGRVEYTTIISYFIVHSSK